MTSAVEANPTPALHRPYSGAAFVSCAALFVIGIYTASIGTVLPELAHRAGMALADAGILFSALFAAAMISTMVAGRRVDRAGYRSVLVTGLLLNGLALLLLPLVASAVHVVGLGLLLGSGDGAVVVAVHTLAAAAAPGREPAALNRLNVLFGFGAIAGPGLAGLARWLDIEPLLLLPLAGCAQVALAATTALIAIPGLPVAGHHTERTARPWSAGLLWLLAIVLLVYVGIEMGLGGWAFTYGREAAGLSGPAAALLSSGFWAALTLGRLLSPWVLRRWQAESLLIGAPVLSCAGAALLLFAGGNAVALWVGVVMTGVGYGPVWPVVFALAARAFPHAAGSVSGILAMVSAFGGLFLPWLQGLALDAGGPQAGIGVTVAGCAVLAALAVSVRGAVIRNLQSSTGNFDRVAQGS